MEASKLCCTTPVRPSDLKPWPPVFVVGIVGKGIVFRAITCSTASQKPGMSWIKRNREYPVMSTLFLKIASACRNGGSEGGVAWSNPLKKMWIDRTWWESTASTWRSTPFGHKMNPGNVFFDWVGYGFSSRACASAFWQAVSSVCFNLCRSTLSLSSPVESRPLIYVPGRSLPVWRVRWP
jgi:hypothetical protein